MKKNQKTPQFLTDNLDVPQRYSDYEDDNNPSLSRIEEQYNNGETPDPDIML